MNVLGNSDGVVWGWLGRGRSWYTCNRVLNRSTVSFEAGLTFQSCPKLRQGDRAHVLSPLIIPYQLDIGRRLPWEGVNLGRGCFLHQRASPKEQVGHGYQPSALLVAGIMRSLFWREIRVAWPQHSLLIRDLLDAGHAIFTLFIING